MPFRQRGYRFLFTDPAGTVLGVRPLAPAVFVGVYDPDATLLAAALAERNLPASVGFTDVEKMLTETSPEAMAIFSSTADHPVLVAAAARHHVHAMMEKPLADLRTTLAEMGLARDPGVTMLEDHLAALFETMRILIAGRGERPPVAPAVQQVFFMSHIAPWVFNCCNAIEACVVANYYRRVAEFGSFFLAVERDSLAMD